MWRLLVYQQRHLSSWETHGHQPNDLMTPWRKDEIVSIQTNQSLSISNVGIGRGHAAPYLTPAFSKSKRMATYRMSVDSAALSHLLFKKRKQCMFTSHSPCICILGRMLWLKERGDKSWNVWPAARRNLQQINRKMNVNTSFRWCFIRLSNRRRGNSTSNQPDRNGHVRNWPVGTISFPRREHIPWSVPISLDRLVYKSQQISVSWQPFLFSLIELIIDKYLSYLFSLLFA